MTFIEKVSYFENSGEINPLLLCKNQKKPLYSRKFFNKPEMLESLKNKKPLRIEDCRGFWYPVPESNRHILRY